MSKDYLLTISRPIRIGEKVKRPKLIAKIIVQDQSDYSDTDVMKMLFSLELAANNHSALPMRTWIEEVPS